MNKHIQIFQPNFTGRDFVVGDIHGCIKEFNKALWSVGFDKSVDRVFSVGDLVDRGPESLKCLDLLMEPWFHAVKGNHEILWYNAHMDSYTYSDRYIFLHNGGEMVENEELVKKYSSLIESMPYLIELTLKSGKRVGIIHAEIPTYVDSWEKLKEIIENDISPDRSSNVDTHPISSLIWGRSRIYKFKAAQYNDKAFPEIEGIDEIYVGHTIVPEPVKYQQFNYIDCGAFLPYWLSEEHLTRKKESGKYGEPRLVIKELK